MTIGSKKGAKHLCVISVFMLLSSMVWGGAVLYTHTCGCVCVCVWEITDITHTNINCFQYSVLVWGFIQNYEILITV